MDFGRSLRTFAGVLVFAAAWGVVGGVVSFSPAAQACASCGSGGASPVVLYPNETAKAYLGLGVIGEAKRVMRDGQEGAVAGPDRQEVVTAGFGYAPARWLSFSGSIPYVTNRLLGEESRAAVGDPLLESRLTAVQAAWDRPWIPQVQGVIGFKKARARSIYETEDPFNLLDVFGNGFDEGTVGTDVWWGMAPAKLGLAYALVFSGTRDAGPYRVERGRRDRTTVSLGTTVMTRLMLTLGAIRQVKAVDTLDGDEVPASDSRQHDAFVSARLNPTPERELRITFVRTAFALRNADASRSQSLTMGYAQLL